jgi:hypothetical protein
MSLRGAKRRGNLTQRWHLTVRSPHFACTDKTPTPRLRHYVRNDKAGHSQRHHPMSLRGAQRRGNPNHRLHTTPGSPHLAAPTKHQHQDCVTTFAMTKQGTPNDTTPCHCEERSDAAIPTTGCTLPQDRHTPLAPTKHNPRDYVTAFAMTKQGTPNDTTPCHCEERSDAAI